MRAYHATCAAGAGVWVDMREFTEVDADGKEHADVGIRFLCETHRPKRAKALNGDMLEDSIVIQDFARNLQGGEVIQMQFLGSTIFGGVVVENRRSERMVVVDILPRGYVDNLSLSLHHVIILG